MKIAIIGIGRMGRRHVEAARSLGLDVAAIADVNAQTLAAAADDLRIEAAYDDPARLLNEIHPEVVIVATTAPSHARWTIESVNAGARFVVCEKPMAVSLAECDAMIAACRERGARLAVNHPMRFLPAYVEPKALVDSDELGGLASITMVAGNCGAAMNGTHLFEALRFVSGERPVNVWGWFSETQLPNPRGAEFSDRAGSIRVATSSGRRLYLEIGDDQGHGVTIVYAGRNGQVIVDELTGDMRITARQLQYREMPTTRYGMPAVERTMKLRESDPIEGSRRVLEALLNDVDYPTGEDGRLAVATLVAAHVSSENDNRRVSIDDALPAERRFPWA
jgi:predicted dehydrogenase